MSYFDEVKPTYLENWPAALHRLSIASVDLPLTLPEAWGLGLNIAEHGEAFLDIKGGFSLSIRPDLAFLRQRVREAVGKFPRGAFLRLGSRSPKDAWSGYKSGFKVLESDHDPLRFFLDCSERTSDDLQLALANDYPPHLWAREWVDIAPWSELRCFMQERKLVGISQYIHTKVFPEVAKFHDTLEWATRHFFERFFGAACSHLDDVVFDVFVKIKEHEGGKDREVEVKLLEINPFGPYTDHCLFSFNDGFDGSFRINS